MDTLCGGRRILLAALAVTLVVSIAIAQESYSPNVDRSYATNVYWGDTHVHTTLSGDAYAFGARLSPADANRFARGETVRADNGQEARLSRPLDFLMVSDHAENLGVLTRLMAGDEQLAATDEGKRWAAVLADLAPIAEWQYAASGYAAVWAHENTRASLFAAMQRREVYATTGPRLVVRFFGGWDFVAEDAVRPDLARVGYGGGVPMGGELSQAPSGKSPSFLISAWKDPDGANLDRVQVIKGWREANGELRERVYDVALSDGRAPDEQGAVEPVGTTVDVGDASYTNAIGDVGFTAVWIDPDFDPGKRAFYYLRVLEIPTPRWTAYDAKFYRLQDVPEQVPMVTQERAYSSPIWYSP